MNYATWILAIAVGLCAGWTDWRSRRIPNWLTIPALAAGVALHGAMHGAAGVVESLKGAGIALAVLLPLVLLRALGGGDWKLLGALGAFLGAQMVLVVLLGAVLIAGAMSAIQVTVNRRWRATLANMRDLVFSLYALRAGGHPRINLDNPTMHSVPFGTATALSVLACFGLTVLR
jgi:prepilin peptidase CpaA